MPQTQLIVEQMGSEDAGRSFQWQSFMRRPCLPGPRPPPSSKIMAWESKVLASVLHISFCPFSLLFFILFPPGWWPPRKWASAVSSRKDKEAFQHGSQAEQHSSWSFCHSSKHLKYPPLTLKGSPPKRQALPLRASVCLTSGRTDNAYNRH